MSYSLDFSVVLGKSQTGLSLKAQLVDTSGSNVGSAVTTGFTEIGVGNYLWHGTIPSDHQGGVVFKKTDNTVMAFADINPPIEIETGVNLRQALSVIGAALGGVLSYDGTSVTIKGLNTATTRITASVTDDGQRTSVTLNLPS